jgi:hypothetical protein
MEGSGCAQLAVLALLPRYYSVLHTDLPTSSQLHHVGSDLAELYESILLEDSLLNSRRMRVIMSNVTNARHIFFAVAMLDARKQ